jgi:hypothetical protein
VDGVELLRGLQLDDDEVFHEHIGAKPFVECDSVDTDGNWHLSFNSKTPLSQSVAKEHFVNRFQQPWSHLRMEFEGLVNDNP